MPENMIKTAQIPLLNGASVCTVHKNYSQWHHYRLLNPSIFLQLSHHIKPAKLQIVWFAPVNLVFMIVSWWLEWIYFWRTRNCDYFHPNILLLPELCQTAEARQHQFSLWLWAPLYIQALETLLIQILNTVCGWLLAQLCVLKVILQWLIKDSIRTVGAPGLFSSLIIFTLLVPLLADCFQWTCLWLSTINQTTHS